MLSQFEDSPQIPCFLCSGNSAMFSRSTDWLIHELQEYRRYQTLMEHSFEMC